MRAPPAIGVALALAGVIAGAGAGGCGSREAPRHRAGEAAPPSTAPGAPPFTAPAGPPGEAVAIAAPGAHELAPVPPVIAPHGAPVHGVVLADGGGAALSLDAGGEVRLWPALDGTREPIVVRVAAARQLALARVGGELVAAITDGAGGGQVQRFDAAGALVGRVTLPVEPPIQELALAGGVVLARRADQTLAAYGVRGDVRGGLAAPPGQRLAAIVARGDAATVAITGAPGPAVRVLQRLALAPRLAWGARIELPEELTQLALAPGGGALAGLAYGQVGRIIELEPRPRIAASIAPSATLSADDLAAIGFVDRERVVLASARVHMQARRARDGWTIEEIPRAPGLRASSPAAIGDGAAVAGQLAGLAFLGLRARFLGYRDDVAGRLQGAPLVVRPSPTRVLWLDERLRVARSFDGKGVPSLGDAIRGHALDGTRLVATRPPLGAPEPRWRIAIFDTVAGTDQEIATGPELPHLAYDHGTRVLAAYGRGRMLRYRLSSGAPTQLRGIPERAQIQRVFLTDPALAGGVVAITTASEAADPGETVANAWTAPRPDEVTNEVTNEAINEARGPLQLASRTRARGSILGADRAGRIYAAESSAVVIYRGGKPIVRLPVVVPHGIAVSEDAASIAVFLDRELIVYNAGGGERWRAPVPLGMHAAWSGGQLVLSTHAGLFAFDGATGRRTALVCGWSFGLHDPVDAPTFVRGPSECAAS